MVKRRQPDLDKSSSSSKRYSSLADSNLTQGKKKRKSKGKNDADLLVKTARDVLFGGKKLKKDISPEILPSSHQETTNRKPKMSNVNENPGRKLVPDVGTILPEINTPEQPRTRSGQSETRSGQPVLEQCEDTQICLSKIVQTFQEPRSSNNALNVGKSKATRRSKNVDDVNSIQKTLKSLAQPLLPGEGGSSKGMVENNEKPEQYQCICKCKSRCWLIAFTHRIEIRGLASVKVLRSDVMIHGYSLKNGATANTYAPAGYHNTIIENERTCSGNRRISLDDHCSGGDPRDVGALKAFCLEHETAAVVEVSELLQSNLNICLQQLPAKVYPGFICLTPSIQVSKVNLDPHYTATTLQAVDHLLAYQSSGKQLKLIICGTKDLGKSTLLRYIVNRILENCDRVAFLDCDPGQSEFGPSGCMALHCVDKPLLGPPWCRVGQGHPDHLSLYGATTADYDPDKYIRCLHRLTEIYNHRYNSFPLVVNTMGWKQDLGLQFLSATISEVCPSHVIQLGVGESSYRNFPVFSVLQVGSHMLFISENKKSNLSEHLRYEVIPLIMDHVPKLDYKTDTIRASLLRELMAVAYLSQNSSCSSLHEITAYRVPMSRLAIQLSIDDFVPPHLLNAAINMQFVALCRVHPNLLTDLPDSHYKQLDVHEESEMLGFGLVRAIDVENKLLYIISPLSKRSIQQVNVLHRVFGVGITEFHLYSQLQQVKTPGLLPYIGLKKSGVGQAASNNVAQVFKRRNV